MIALLQLAGMVPLVNGQPCPLCGGHGRLQTEHLDGEDGPSLCRPVCGLCAGAGRVEIEPAGSELPRDVPVATEPPVEIP